MAHVVNPTPGVQLSPTGQLATSSNFISSYDYATQYEPDRVLKLHSRYGNGLITGFTRITGAEKPYASDLVKHAEEGRLMQISSGVTRTADAFTTTTAHNLRVGDIVKASDGTNENIIDVTAIGSTTTFTGISRLSGGHSIGTTAISLYAFSSDFPKGAGGFQVGRTWDPVYYDNYSQIIKEYFDVSESDMAHSVWVKTNAGEFWFNYDMDRTYNMMQNKIELTHIFMQRAEAGSAVASAATGNNLGMQGIVPTVKSRGNVGNGLIEDLTEMDAVIFRLQKQGVQNSYTVWCDSNQMVAFYTMLGDVNKWADTGANYGTFRNSKELAVYLDFQSFVRQGITFHLTPWRVLIDPTLDGGTGFTGTSIAAMFMPDGQKTVLNDDGAKEDQPYLMIRYRQSSYINRRLRTKIEGLPGNEIDEDKLKVQHIAEQTNQVVGANEYYLVNR